MYIERDDMCFVAGNEIVVYLLFVALERGKVMGGEGGEEIFGVEVDELV